MSQQIKRPVVDERECPPRERPPLIYATFTRLFHPRRLAHSH